jgi:hypothetical protein
MAAIIDSRESEKIFVAGARQFIAGYASMVAATFINNSIKWLI